MNILIRKLIFNEADIHLILWGDRPCFLVSEISSALDCVNKEDIPVFLRNGSNAIKGMHYDVIAGQDAKELKQNLEDSGIKKKFVQTMLVYFDGLKKYFNFRRTIEIKDFNDYLTKCKISLDDEAVAYAGTIEAFDAVAAPPVPQAQPEAVSTPVIQPKPDKKKRSTPPPKQATANSSYSDFLKHLDFMEEFVAAFNKVNIPSDKSVAFTKEMVKFLEDNGISAIDMLRMLKKWS